MNIYYEELIQMIMKAEKSPNLLPASWRLTKARGVILVLRACGLGVNSGPRPSEDLCPTQA